jgi:hypothetical protein
MLDPFGNEVNAHWNEEEPDGSMCCECGNRCYLKQYRVLMFYPGNPEPAWVGRYCQTCRDLHNDGEDWKK